MTALAPYLTAITDLTATANGGGNNQGEPASNNPPPSITSRPAALSKNLPEARLAFDHIPALTIEAISENRFDIKDLWKLDPLRIAELSIPARGSFLSQLEHEMNDTEEHRRSRARARYTEVAQILSWLVYAQLRDLLTPESRIGWHRGWKAVDNCVEFRSICRALSRTRSCTLILVCGDSFGQSETTGDGSNVSVHHGFC